MGRELQKKKNKSSLPRATQKRKSKKAVLTNPLIAANWDAKQTLSQNYRRLGLVNKLNRVTGGVDRTPTAGRDAANIPIQNNGMAINPKAPSSGPLREAKVERDPETGQILRVIEPRANPLNDPLNDLDSDDDEPMMASQHDLRSSKPTGNTAVVAALEAAAAVEGKKKKRSQSEREQEWLEALMQKHGEDYRKMWRDMKLNPMQQSEGDIRKRVEKLKRSQQGI
ncbi:hypothetical protein P152DRAFT_452994 [Eremomyces bilateralis CBS 781.70]|uniref:Nucleolar protein 16 n=1 Tax=Eremomyces bilateralis CBS 781.70 TaxID=1392243 RepID=A0A6G1FRE9_9PEZI|nr:uncharacterized protein P152DRAFT_452994 [Eremomyces bilateralis CBS 781.70]KAF1808308.1 hypothetical protein P152DRAFT_452994 [Eremomyces bilateralis CBS 781.70]